MTKSVKVRDEEIRRRMGVDKDLLSYIVESRLMWYEHVRRASENRGHKDSRTEFSALGKAKRDKPRRS